MSDRTREREILVKEQARDTKEKRRNMQREREKGGDLQTCSELGTSE
jgi:hypothetical protein